MRHGWLPGVKTIDAIADDVHRKHLAIPLSDHSFGPPGADVAFINAKGFGGNNATGVLFSARVAQSMVERRQAGGWKGYCGRRDTVRALAGDYEHRADRGELAPIYRFGEGVIEDSEVLINDREIAVPGYGKTVSLSFDNPFVDMV
jgi:acetoacetyl-[acyl-carrier protein] synthase